jgi:hypothetical protein
MGRLGVGLFLSATGLAGCSASKCSLDDDERVCQ